MAPAPAPAPSPALAPPSSPVAPASGRPLATTQPPVVHAADLTLATNPLDELILSAAPPPSPFFDLPYVKAGQVALRCFLGCGNAMGLEFEDDCSYYLRLDITTPALHLASPLYIAFDYSNRSLDALVVAALLQAVLGGSVAHFFVAQCSPLVFRFHVASARVAEIILAQTTIRCRHYSFSFVRKLPSFPHPPHSAATCMTLAQLLQIPDDLGFQFEAVAWSQLRSQVTVRSGCQSHGCRMYARVIQFPFTLNAVTMALVLAHLFGGSYLHFNTTDDGDSCFSFTVASPAIAKLIASMGDFHKRGMPIRFPWPQLMGGAQRPLRAAVKIPSLGPVSSSSSPFAFATLPTPSSTLDLPKT
ncbi:uncharacterized protein [Aegilops tauschii subsp. strangulata]|uniref:uncharacterized protein n=1 Tax=Aegilops tauschii subsp. strangulata TaxID=200361 RepID=UPI00098A9573|nr:uncharacterized protein LOC109787527 [Aegilops tauschii subsp. strangulata]